MDPSYSAEAETFREKVQAFLAEHLPAEWRGIGALDPEAATAFTAEWRDILRDNQLLAPSWPTSYGGGGLSPVEEVVLVEELVRAGVPSGGSNDIFSIKMVGNTILRWGTDEQKAYHLPRIISGEDTWCQGYSEPNAGSDLGNLGCRALLDGDEWILNGQKIWTSYGHLADWIFVLCRTNPDAPKHKGISFLLCPMDQPGIELRPILMLNRQPEFNEVFFTDARCPAENVLGGVDNGWAVAMTLLGFERGEAAATDPLKFRDELDRLIGLARDRGAASDPVIRQRLAWAYSKVEIMRFLGMRTVTDFVRGKAPGSDAAIHKLNWSEYHKTVTELAVDILGAEAMAPTGKAPHSAIATDLPGSNPLNAASWAGVFATARAGTIYAGTSQVQRNILGEQVLGLPKEPRGELRSWSEDQRAG